jgi:RNA polymerase sigma-70 factor (ECF subfamily)
MFRLKMDARADFPTTHWTLLRQSGRDDRAAGARALDELLRRYLPALRTHLVAVRRLTPDRADDVLQEFITAKILERNLLETADPQRGRFRTLLLTTLDRFLISQLRRDRADFRAPHRAQDIDAPHAPPLPARAPDASAVFDAAWAREVIAAALERMRSACDADGRPDVWRMFDVRIVRPLLENAAPADYAQLAQELSIPSPSAASNLLVTGKRAFTRALRSVIAEYASPEEIEEEVRELQQILSQAGASGD